MKKLTSILLIMCMLFTASTVTCYAEDISQTVETITFRDMEIKFDHSTNTLYFSATESSKTISGRYFHYYEDEFLVYDEETKKWIYDYSQLNKLNEVLLQAKKIVIEEGVSVISEDFFHDLPDLEEITLPNTLKTIGKFAFWNCTNLKSIYGKNVTKIEAGAFGRCTSLSYANFPQLRTLYGERLPLYYEDEYGEEHYWAYPVHEYYVGAFQECTALKEINIPNLERLGAKTFYKCSSLTNINEDNKLDKVICWAYCFLRL